MTLVRILRIGVLIGVVLAAGRVADAQDQRDTSAEEPRPTKPTLRLDVSCADSPIESAVRLTLANQSGSDTAVNLGIALANGRKYLPIALILRIHRSGLDRSEDLRFGDPRYVFISGRIDPWVQTLPQAAVYTLSVPLAHFIKGYAYTTAHVRFEVPIEDFEAELAIESQPADWGSGADLLARVWTGTLRSNRVRIPASCVAWS